MKAHLHFETVTKHPLRATLLATSLVTTSFAADGTTAGVAADASFNWDAGTTAPWNGGTVADGAGFTANFTADITAARTVTIAGANKRIGNITFTDGSTSSHNLTIARSSTFGLILDNGSSSPVLGVTQGDRQLIITAPVSGSNGFTKSGPGNLFLNNSANTFTGSVILNGGWVQMNGNGNFGDNANDISVTANSVLYSNFGGTLTLHADRTINLSANLLFNGLTGNNRAWQVNGPINGTGNFSLTGPTTNLTLTGANTFTGSVSIVAGGQTTASSNHTILQVGTSATDSVSTLGDSNNNVSLGGFAETNEGVASVNGSAVLRFRRNDYTHGGDISGTGMVEISPLDANNVEGSTITLEGDNSYTGQTKIEQGALKVASSWDGGSGTGSLAPANIRINQQAVLIIAGDLDPAGAADFSRPIGTADGEIQWTNGGGFAAFGAPRTVNLGGAGAPLSWSQLGGNLGNALFLSHPDADAKLIFENPIDLNSTAGNRIFRVPNGSAAMDGEVSGVISGGSGVGIQKNDGGSLVLSAVNTYSGPTIVNDGTLAITGSIDASPVLDPRGNGVLDLTAVAPYSIATGRTLTGTGIVQGSINLSGVLSPGLIAVAPAVNLPGTLTTGSITLGSSASFVIDIDSSTTTADRLVVEGAMDLGSATLSVSDVAASPVVLPAPTSLKIIDYSGQTLTGTFSGLPEGSAVIVGSNSFTIRYAADTNSDNVPDAVVLEIGGNGYQAWAADKALVGPAADFGADPDSDGVPNGLEFVLGGEPNPAHPSFNSAKLLPAVSSSPAGLVFSFKRKDLSEGAVTLVFQWSADLAFPPSNEVPVGAGDSSVDGIIIDVTENIPDSETDTIEITVPAAKAVNGRLFGRLVATPS
ncbi:MAG: autotransporter-associated beta strand repeat-containing protein [Akkermansiaceae bacterium]|jgi:autotransporter-associated beta strand protein|nr:autotransporter-associated beta strand repeat-containing protein [Akkermansiaceae bacterium]